MIRRIGRGGPSLAFFGVFQSEENPHDAVDDDKIIHLYPSDTGLQRLRNLFRPTQSYDLFDPKVTAVAHVFYGSFIAGGVYGGVKKSREAFINFIEQNEATRFTSHLEAKRKLSDTIFKSFISGGVKWGLKISFFCTIFSATYTAITVYRNKDSALHYAAGGMAAGALYKVPLGPKGMISGGFFGLLFGGFYGGLKYLLLTLSNLTEDDLRNQKHKITIERLDAISGVKKEMMIEKEKEEIKNLILDPALGK